MAGDVAEPGVTLVELGTAAAVHHLEETSPEATQWRQRSMTAHGTAGISRCSKLQKHERMAIANLARWPCQLLAARGQPNEEVWVDKREKICPSHYQSAGTLGLVRAGKWELSRSLAFLPTVTSSFNQLLKPWADKSILRLLVWVLLACNFSSDFLTQSQIAALHWCVQ